MTDMRISGSCLLVSACSSRVVVVQTTKLSTRLILTANGDVIGWGVGGAAATGDHNQRLNCCFQVAELLTPHEHHMNPPSQECTEPGSMHESTV